MLTFNVISTLRIFMTKANDSWYCSLCPPDPQGEEISNIPSFLWETLRTEGNCERASLSHSWKKVNKKTIARGKIKKMIAMHIFHVWVFICSYAIVTTQKHDLLCCKTVCNFGFKSWCDVSLVGGWGQILNVVLKVTIFWGWQNAWWTRVALIVQRKRKKKV